MRLIDEIRDNYRKYILLVMEISAFCIVSAVHYFLASVGDYSYSPAVENPGLFLQNPARKMTSGPMTPASTPPSLAPDSATGFAVVRFGNVLGSVIPLNGTHRSVSNGYGYGYGCGARLCVGTAQLSHRGRAEFTVDENARKRQKTIHSFLQKSVEKTSGSIPSMRE